MSGKNRLFKSGKSIQLRWDFAGTGFLEKVPDSGQSRSRNPVQPYHTSAAVIDDL